MAIKIIQLLCPKRHCIFALAFDSAETDDTAALSFAEIKWTRMTAKDVDPWCGLCLSKDLTFEIGTTRFTTMDEAAPALKASENAQILARALIMRKQSRDN